ncbi:MAG: DNA recombination protein RmuC [Ginsengibacter sp.]
MNIEFLIIGLIAFLVGAIIAWFIAKSNSNSKITELQTKFEAAEQFALKMQQEVADANEKLRLSQKELGQVQQEKAGSVKEVEILADSLRDYKQQLTIKQENLTSALEAKTTAETTLLNVKETIEELQKRESDLTNDIEELRKQVVVVKEENAGLAATENATMQRLEDQQKFVEDAQKNLKDAFGALSADALQNNNTSFVELAKAKLEEKVTEARGEFEKKEQAIGELVRPLGESLKTMDTKIQDLEGRRIRAYSDIWNYLDQVKITTEGLKKETTNLVGALKTSHSRGRYGEIALRRLVEHAGMFEHCDFEEQVSVEDETGKLRPDMIIKLPGNKTLVVDSKAPLSSYMKMFETDDQQQQKLLLGQHVVAVKDHLRKLSAKAYWSQFNDAPDFVIMYMHIESSYAVASQAYPEMIEDAMKNRIIIATPTILLSILLGVGYSWNQLKTMENIESIRDAAVELHDRSAVLMDHLVNIGKGLNGTITHYNKTIGSLESSFLPQARKINTLSQAYTKKQIPEVLPIELSVRHVNVVPQLIESSTITDLPVEE